MLKKFVLTTTGILLSTICAFAQPSRATGDEYIKVKGLGEIKRAPDWFKVYFRFSSDSKNKADAYKIVAQKEAQVMNELKELGIGEERIWKEITIFENGVRNDYTLTLENKIKLSKLIGLLVRLQPDDLRVSYDLKDRASAELEALEKATADAKLKAETIAQTTGSVITGTLIVDEHPEISLKQLRQETLYIVDGVPTRAPLGGLGAVMGGKAQTKPVIVIEPDEITITKEIMAVFKIADAK